MAQKNWKDHELKDLRRYYGHVANIDLAFLLGRSKSAIQHKAMRLGLSTKLYAKYKYCIDCGIKLSRASCYKPSAKRCFPCSMKAHSGAGHHNWNGGIAELRSLIHVRLKPAWIDPILARDNFTCQSCKKRGGDMEVHHLRPYHKIRDMVIKRNKNISIETFDGKVQIADLVVAEHNLSDGITLCVQCHSEIHNRNRVNSGEALPNNVEGNPEPSRGKVIHFVPRKVQRPMTEDYTANKVNTSARLAHPKQDDMVCSYEKS